MFCGECGTKLEEGMRFCPECGTPVKMPDFSQAAAEKPQEMPAPEPELEPEGVPEAEPMVEAVPEPAAEPVAEAVAESEAEPMVEALPEPEAEPLVETATEPEAEPVAEAVPEPAAEPEPLAETMPEPEAEPLVETAPEPEAEPVVETVPEPEPAPEVAAAPVEKGVRRGPQVYIPPQKPKPERKPARTGPQVYIPPQGRVVPQPAPMPEPTPSPVPKVEPVPMPEEAPQVRMPEETPQAKMPEMPVAPSPVPMVEPVPMPESVPMPEEVPQAKMPEMPADPEPVPMPEEAPQARMQEAPAAMPRAGKLIAEFDKGGGNMIRYFDDHIEFDGISVAYADIDYADEEASTTSARGLVFASHYHGHIEFVLKNGEKRKLKVSGTSVYGIGGSGGAKKRFHAIREPFYSIILTYLGERKAREIEQGATVVVGGVSVSPERMDVTKALGHKELTLSREEFGSAVLRTFDIMIRKKDGSKWTTIYRRIPNANILPYVLNRVYGNSTAPVTLEEEQPGMNEET